MHRLNLGKATINPEDQKKLHDNADLHHLDNPTTLDIMTLEKADKSKPVVFIEMWIIWQIRIGKITPLR